MQELNKPQNLNNELCSHQNLRAIELNLVRCHCCGKLNHFTDTKLSCTRCYSVLHSRQPHSLDRSLAFLVAATILYIPANLLPMTITDSILGGQQDTIMSGVIYFWKSEDYFVSIVIFTASIFIPLLKLVILYFLIITVYIKRWKRWNFSPSQCAIFYRIVEFVGRWSMIDVFVVALLTALVQIHSLATILAGSGSVAFCTVVVLTMLASMSFDPRMIWDNQQGASLNSNSGIQLPLNKSYSNSLK
ncbi:MAG: paraquat-inducible protein A [Acinetobacter sp.]